MLSLEETAPLQRKLDLNEWLVWSGKPLPWAFTKQTTSAMIFGIVWCVLCGTFAGIFLSMLWLGDGSASITINGRPSMVRDLSLAMKFGLSAFFVPFLLLGSGMLLAPLWCRLWSSRLIYAVTNRRALRSGRCRVTAWRAAQLLPIDRADRRNGCSDLFFTFSTLQHRTKQFPPLRLTGFVNLPTSEASAAEIALRTLRGEENHA